MAKKPTKKPAKKPAPPAPPPPSPPPPPAEPLYRPGTPVRCGARTKVGRPCGQPSMPNGRCRLHGGLTPSGAALPQYKHGRYSKYVPERLAARYSEFEADPELIALRHELALTDARITDLLARVDTGESGATWKRLLQAVDAYRQMESLGVKPGIAEIEAICRQGLGDYAAWDGVMALVEQRRKLAESEAKRVEKTQESLDVGQAMNLMTTVMAVIRAHVQDRETLSAISAAIGDLAARGA